MKSSCLQYQNLPSLTMQLQGAGSQSIIIPKYPPRLARWSIQNRYLQRSGILVATASTRRVGIFVRRLVSRAEREKRKERTSSIFSQ
jgi:hypothetical protein